MHVKSIENAKTRCCDCRPSNKRYCTENARTCRCRKAGTLCVDCGNGAECCQNRGPVADADIKESASLAQDCVTPSNASLVHGPRTAHDGIGPVPAPTKIKFPSAGDRKHWSAVNKVLMVSLPKLFTREHIESSSVSSLASKLSVCLFSTMLEQFGEKKEVQQHHQKKVDKPNKALQELRDKKKDLKKARRILFREGDTKSHTYHVLTKQWHETAPTCSSCEVYQAKGSSPHKCLSATQVPRGPSQVLQIFV